MYHFVIVGAGSLGSNFAIEASRRSASAQMPLKITILDYDKVEERNIYSQDFLPEHIGKNKAEVISSICNQYEGIDSEWVDIKVDENSIYSLPSGENVIIIDAVDNIPTRQNLWFLGKVKNHPVLHLGMSTSGFGYISWNFMEYDTFAFSPGKITQEKIDEISTKDNQKLPPCQLNGFRSLIINTSLAGVNAAFIFLGKDTSSFVSTEDSKLDFPGLATNWHTTLTEMTFLKETTTLLDWPLNNEQKQEQKEALLVG